MPCDPQSAPQRARRPHRRVVACWLGVVLVAASCFGANAAADEGIEFYEKRIRPLLVEHCYACHAGKSDALKGGLRLDTAEGIRAGGDSGPVLVPGDPQESLLITAVSYSGEFVNMPPKRRLPAAAIADLRKWVSLGAPLPGAAETQSAVAAKPGIDIEQGRKFWSFQPVREMPLPAVSQAAWPQTRLDYFVLAKLEERGLNPSAGADRRRLIRRLYFDLIGLPPTFDEVEAFVADTRPDAFEQLVDRLLASPHYGERWARHWLDVARYAEDNPTNESTCKPPRFAFRYRDWVIAALNDDLAYDDFVRRQLAADLMEHLPPSEFAATGFLGLSPIYHKEPKLSAEVIATIVADEWDERLDTVTRAFLGLTAACARCHNHKFDPIRTEDYYALAGVMASTRLVEWPLVPTDAAAAAALSDTREALVDAELRLSYARAMKKTAAMAGEPTEAYEAQAEQYQQQVDELRARELLDGPIANGVRDAALTIDGSDPAWTALHYHPGQGRDLPVFIRGNPSRQGDLVPRRFLEVLSPATPTPFASGSGRRELAEAIVSDAQGLTARVIVNRVWGWHFGQPLVRTPSNFGALGERPSHPELLNDLAARFVAQGWSLKWLHREIVLSATWRQSADIRHDGSDEIDPDNRLLWRMNRRRLEPEVWRDALLAATGALDTRAAGPSQDLDEPHNGRRSVYGVISRQKVPDVLRLFDFPDAKRHADERLPTTTPLQQLYLLNSPLLRDRAAALVAQMGTVCDVDSGVVRLFRRVLLRQPTEVELQAARRLLSQTSSSSPEDWQLLAHGLLASNEFLFVD